MPKFVEEAFVVGVLLAFVVVGVVIFVVALRKGVSSS